MGHVAISRATKVERKFKQLSALSNDKGIRSFELQIVRRAPQKQDICGEVYARCLYDGILNNFKGGNVEIGKI